MKKKAEYKVERSMPTYSRIRDACWSIMKEAKEEVGLTYKLMATMLFSAFCLEAYFNHVGEKKLSNWPVLKKKLSPAEKPELIPQLIGLTIDFGSLPFQTFKTIFKFRNLMVHAESEYLVAEGGLLLVFPEYPSACWRDEWATEVWGRQPP